MKLSKFMIPLFLTIGGTLPGIMQATPNQQSDSPQNTFIVLKKENHNNHKRRPNAPNRQHVNCIYNGGIFTINFTIPEGECTCCITDLKDNHTYHHSFDTSQLVVEIEVYDISDFHIEIITENGNVYTGTSFLLNTDI